MVHGLSEAARQGELTRVGILNTAREVAFDRVVFTASQLFRMPFCAISFIDGDRQWFKASVGLDVSETRRSDSFCTETILSDYPLVINDARLDDRFSANPYVVGSPHIRFYAGQSIFGPQMMRLGTLCVMDRVERDFTPENIRLLHLLADEVSDIIITRTNVANDRKARAGRA